MIYPGGKVSGGDLFHIYLNRFDTDTLEVLYTVRKGRCFTTVDYTVFFFNGVQTYMNGQNATLILKKSI